jgi:hypothetical protein
MALPRPLPWSRRILGTVLATTLACGLVAPEPGLTIGYPPAPDSGESDASFTTDSGSTSQPEASLPDVAAPFDAPAVYDAPAEASETGMDAADADDATSDAVADTGSPCFRACAIGDMQCVYTPYSCVRSDGGETCSGGGLAGVSTCVLDASGCQIWSPEPAACSESFGCCVPCVATPCEAGSPYDCGYCPVGPRGSPCTHDSACGSNACDGVSHLCASSPCADHRQDGDETDIDCGGNQCSACGSGQQCALNFDCQSGECLYPSHVCR